MICIADLYALYKHADIDLDYPWSAKVANIVDFKSAYIPLNIGPRGLACEAHQKEIMLLESSDVVRFDLRPDLPLT